MHGMCATHRAPSAGAMYAAHTAQATHGIHGMCGRPGMRNSQNSQNSQISRKSIGADHGSTGPQQNTSSRLKRRVNAVSTRVNSRVLKRDTLFVALEITMPISALDSFIDHDDAWPWQTEMFWVTETLNDGAKMRFKVKCKLCSWL